MKYRIADQLYRSRLWASLCRLIRVSLMVALVCVASPFGLAQAQSCDAVFPAGLQSHSNSGQIKFDWNAQLLNNPSTEIQVAQVKSAKWSVFSSCGTEACVAATETAAGVSIDFAESGGGETISLGYREERALGGQAEYGHITLGAEAQLTLSQRQDGYQIKRLELAHAAKLILAPGDYWVEKLELASKAAIQVAGEGTARLYVKHKISFPFESSVNVGDDGEPENPGRLFLYSQGDIQLQTGARVSALVYTQKRLSIAQAELYGSASFHHANLGSSARVHYQPEALAQSDLVGVCSSGTTAPEEPELPDKEGDGGHNACQATWPNGLQVHAPDGAVHLHYNAQLHSGSSNKLHSPTVTVSGASSQKSCGDTHCTAGGAPVEKLDAGAFEISDSDQNVQVPWQASVSLGGEDITDYGVIDIAASAALDFASASAPYRIKALYLGYNSSLTLPSGDYWLETLSLEAESRIEVSGNGSVRIFVKNALYVPWQAKLNLNTGDSSQLILYHYGDIDFHSGSRLNGLVYAQGDVSLNHQAQVSGGLTARNITLNSDSHLTYVPAAVLVANYGDLCPNDPNPLDQTPPELTVVPADSETEAESLTLIGTVVDPEEPNSGVASVVVSTESHQITAALDGDQFTATVPLALGDNTITVTATDHSDNTQVETLTIRRIEPDETPPVIDIQNSDGQSSEASLITIGGTVIDPQQAGSGVASLNIVSDRYPELDFAVQLQLPGFSAQVPLAVGDNRFTLVALDLSGNRTEASLTIRRLSPPQILGLTPQDGAVVQEPKVTISGMIKTLQPLSDLRFSIDEWQLTPSAGTEEGTYHFVLRDVPLQLGQNHFSLRVTSPDGTAERSLTLGHTPEDADAIPAPVLTLLEPLDGSLLSAASFRLRGHVTSQGGAVTLSLNGQPLPASGSGQQDYYFNSLVSFPEGQNHLEVNLTATDALGKTTTLSADYYRDDQAPQIQLLGLSESPAVNAVLESPYPVTGTVTDDNLAGLTVNDQPVSLRPGDQAGEYRFSFGLPLAPGASADLVLAARDLGGNRTLVEYHLVSEASAEIQPLLPGENTELIGRGEPIELQVAARLSNLSSGKVRVSTGSVQADLEFNGTLASGTLSLPATGGEHTLLYELLSDSGQLLASASRTLTVVDEQSIPLNVLRHEPENNSQHVEANQPIEFYFNRAIDPAQITLEVRETLHGETYVNLDPAGIDFLNAEGFQLHNVHRDREQVPGSLNLLPGGQGLVFYPARHFGFNAHLYVDLLYAGEELAHFTFKVRPLPTFILGGVRDQFGQPLAGIKVSLPELGRSVQTNSEGSFAFGFQERPGSEIPAGRHRLVVNPEFGAPGFGTQVQYVNVQAGRRNDLEITRLTALHPEVPFQLVSSYQADVSLASGDLHLDLSETRLLFNNGRTSGNIQAQFLPFEQLHTQIMPGAIPYWMFGLQPRGVRVEGNPVLTLTVPALRGNYDYLAPNVGYVVLLGYEPEGAVIRPVGIGYLENRRVTSVGPLNLEVLDFIGFAQVDPRIQDELEAVAKGESSLRHLQTLLQQQTALQP